MCIEIRRNIFLLHCDGFSGNNTVIICDIIPSNSVPCVYIPLLGRFT